MAADGSTKVQPSLRTTDVWYYQKDLPELTKPARRILETYSGISPEDTASHLHEVRTRAWEIFPYPSIGNWHFLHLGILDQPRYPEILLRLQQGHRLIDVGCGFAQDLRQLLSDGAPPASVHGLDLERGFVDLGYDLFRDRARLPPANFTAADILDTKSGGAKDAEGTFDVVYASQFFHLWSWDRQVEVGKAVVKLLKRARGSLIVGYQIGAVVGWETQDTPTKEGKMYLHDRASLRELWGEIGALTGTEWTVDAWLDEAEIFSSYAESDDNLRRISFAIEQTG